MSNSIDVILLAGLAAGVLAVAFLLAVWRQQVRGGSRSAAESARAEAAALPSSLRSEVIRLLVAGRKIEAVKRVREATGWGLKRSKVAVEALGAENLNEGGNQWAAERESRDPSANLDAEVGRLLAARRKIEAIKLVRERTGRSLKEAKEYVERME